MDERCTNQGSCSDRGVLAHPVGSLHLLCRVRLSANDQTLGLPTELFQIVLAKVVQQHDTASSLRLTCRSLAHGCAALVTGTFHLRTPNLHCLSERELQRWLWQVGVLQRAFPNSTLELDDVVYTTDQVHILQLLNCIELSGVTICPTPVPGGPVSGRPFWQAIATLGRLHGSRLQLHVPQPGALRMLEAEPSLAAHVSQADLRFDPTLAWSADAGSSLVDHISSLSSLTQLILPIRTSLLGKAGMLDALRQLSALQDLFCMGHDMETLLINSVPRSWSLLTKLELGNVTNEPDLLDWSLVEQQCPQLQALAMHNAVPLCLTALTSLTCQVWYPPNRDCFQFSRLGDLYMTT